MRLRKSVRLLILNHKNETLLSRYEGLDIHEPGFDRLDSHWEVIGGGIDKGETLLQAAMREAYEESGLTADDLNVGPIIWQGQNEVVYNGEHLAAHHTYMLAHLTREIAADDIIPQGLTEEELGFMVGFKWWSADELKITKENIIPSALRREFPKIIKGVIPNPPLTLNMKFGDGSW
uniref:Nudix hydrolase domain-containing protein n=1 Tax=OCS116 cluster bacterium TaxID=2030921 RepID=A0A2A4Z3H6_9PROT